MRRFAFSSLPSPLRNLVKEKNPLEEDIGLYDRGRLVGVLITPAFYRFAVKMAEAAEDQADRNSVRKFSMRKKK
jgi:hypothetical protein